MQVSAARLIAAVAPFNNRYRQKGMPAREKLAALWDMGDKLLRLGVRNPHSVGWKIQRETRGLIKRPTVFRSCKLRSIWPSKRDLMNDLGGITGLSVLTEMLPLIDPAQKVRQELSSRELRELFRHAAEDSPAAFKQYSASLKARFASGRLGRPLDRAKHLRTLRLAVAAFARLFEVITGVMVDRGPSRRNDVRAGIPSEELVAFANMCIALTTKENAHLYRGLGPRESGAASRDFRVAYDTFRKLLSKPGDVERARLRRLIHADVLAKMSDMLSSIGSEASVADFRERQKLVVRI